MLIDYESIIILNESVCSDFIEGDINFEIFQSMSPLMPKPNCFIQNSSAIQYINPMLSGKEGKLKFSISYKINELSSLKYAAVVFNKNINCTAEIRIKNEVITNGKTEFRILKLVPVPESEKLELSFISMKSENDDISEQIRMLDEQKENYSQEISELKIKLSDEKEEAMRLSTQKSSLEEELLHTRAEVEKILSEQNELDDLTRKRETLRHNLQEAAKNNERASELSQQLSYYSDILMYYKSNEGYQTITDKINELENEISNIQQHISVFAQKRNEQIEQITDQLNI